MEKQTGSLEDVYESETTHDVGRHGSMDVLFGEKGLASCLGGHIYWVRGVETYQRPAFYLCLGW